jgi:GTP pyrophosphokinase
MRLSHRFREALQYMYDLHEDQERRGSGIPYLGHLMGVAALSLEFGADEDQAIAALLHDAAEDQGGGETLSEIESRFGERVARIVRDCSDTLAAEKPPWRERKARYLAHLAAAPAESQLVSACDKLYNLRTIVYDYRNQGEALWRRFGGGREGTLWYYREITKIIPESVTASLGLRRAMSDLESLLEPVPAGA